MRESNASWKFLILAGLLPILVLVAIVVSLGGEYPPESFKRFGNALLTSYVGMGLTSTWQSILLCRFKA